MYETLQVIHVVAATVWVGGAVFHLFASAQLASAPPPVRVWWAELGDAAGRLFYMPAALVTLLAGIGTVVVGDLDWGEPFISIGFAGVVVSLGLGMGLIRPTALRLIDEARGDTPDPSRLAALGDRMRMLSTTNAVVLLVVVWAMVARPGG